MLSKKNTSNLIVVFSSQEFKETDRAFVYLQDDFYVKYVEKIEQSFNATGNLAKEYSCLDFGGTNIPGIKFDGFYEGNAGIGEIYNVIINKRPVTLAYVRSKTDDLKDQSV